MGIISTKGDEELKKKTKNKLIESLTAVSERRLTASLTTSLMVNSLYYPRSFDTGSVLKMLISELEF